MVSLLWITCTSIEVFRTLPTEIHVPTAYASDMEIRHAKFTHVI